MKKIFIIACLFMSCALSANAQVQVQTATLKQEESVQVFYGANALVDAVNAAQGGNTIYLSAGTFTGNTTLGKDIKIIGAGGFNSSENQNTFIKSLSIERGNYKYFNDRSYLELEGFVITGSLTIFNSDKIRMKKIKFNSDITCRSRGSNDVLYFKNIEIIQCLLTAYLNFHVNEYYTGIPPNYSDIVITNSILTGGFGGMDYNYYIRDYIQSISSILVTNCIIYRGSPCLNMLLKNNIIVANQSSATASCSNNNIFTGAGNFSSRNQSGNWENVVLSDLFVNQPENKWDATYDYHLKNPENYIGTDGTQVGIYGGLFPWNTVLSNPKIIESKVNRTTSNDGKLNFQIKAEAQQ